MEPYSRGLVSHGNIHHKKTIEKIYPRENKRRRNHALELWCL